MQPEATLDVGSAAATDRYLHGYGAEFTEMLAARTAAAEVGFFVAQLRPGMRVLDAGCGPGAITLDLAAVVGPGEVVGVDVEASQVERARGAAKARGLDNIQFELGNVAALPFPDASFDAALLHTVLEHVRSPRDVLREIRRVLRPGGVVGIRDPDYATWLWSPLTPTLEQMFALVLRVHAQQGGSPYYARHQRRSLREAAFARTEAFADAVSFGRTEQTQRFATSFAAQLREPGFQRTVQQQGWADAAALAAMEQAVRDWGADPDAALAFLMCAALGWVDGTA